MKRNPCTKDIEFRFLCSCDDCSRLAAGRWNNYMDRVFEGSIDLYEAQRLYDTEPTS